MRFSRYIFSFTAAMTLNRRGTRKKLHNEHFHSFFFREKTETLLDVKERSKVKKKSAKRSLRTFSTQISTLHCCKMLSYIYKGK